jgi:hypothetical protein
MYRLTACRLEYEEAARMCSILALDGGLPQFSSGPEWDRIWRHVAENMAALHTTWDFYLWFPYKMAGVGVFVLDTPYSKDDNNINNKTTEEKQVVYFNDSFWSRGQPNGVQATCLDCNEEGRRSIFNFIAAS